MLVCTANAIKTPPMASNYVLHFHMALSFRLCTFKMLPLLGDSVPRPTAGVSPMDPNAEWMNKTFAAYNESKINQFNTP